MFDNIFRLNPLFSYTPFEELSSDQKRKFKHLLEDKNFCGFLHAPREAGLTVKAVNQDLANFLQKLGKPTRLEDIFTAFDKKAKEDKEDFVVKLVLDSVLEVKHNDKFISGVEAINKVLSPVTQCAPRKGTDREKNQTQLLSDRSIYFALNSALTQPRDLSFLLYNFNRIPLSRRWGNRLSDETAVLIYLGLKNDGSWDSMPESVTPKPVNKNSDAEISLFDLYWRVWKFKGRTISRNKPTYKVYFSPHPEDLPAVFRIVRDVAVKSDAYSMKIGRNLSGILRADKFIVYFPEYLSAFKFAEEMSTTLTSFHNQGNPFSFQVHQDNSLVSMGVDPPRTLGETSSWRIYITNKLALAIQGVRRTGAEDPISYIHTYMRMVGVDSYNWCPLNNDWSIEFQIEEQDNEQQ